MSAFHYLKRNLSNSIGWRTNRKLVVFESDDWGSIRMPSKKVFESLVKSGIRVDRNYFTTNDSLESNTDIELLFEVLSEFRDFTGKNPVFTSISIMANPDFERIRKSEFQNYYYEPFPETLSRYPDHNRVLELWKSGIKNRLFIPQFHGREHLNVSRWMSGLKNNLKTTHLTFNLGVTGIKQDVSLENRKDYQAAFDYDSKNDIDDYKLIITDGINIFKNILNYQPEHFVAPNGIWNPVLDPVLKESGISSINSPTLLLKTNKQDRYYPRIRYLGKINRSGLMYIMRNAVFEPGKPGVNDWVDSCLRDISLAFRWKKPAVISTHRANYIGQIFPENRERGLIQLRELLYGILKRWPEAEFITTPNLGQMITGTREKYDT